VQARRALQFCVDKLNEGDRFNVVRFSTGFDVLFSELKAATQDNRAAAQNFAASFNASGGTNIGDTLRHVLGMRPVEAGDETRPFVVVFLTDGQGNRKPDEILPMLGTPGAPGAPGNVRIFPFGVGHDVNTILLDRLANTYTGRPTYVGPGENLELVLGDFFSVVSRPVLTNLSLSLPAVGVTEQFPASLGDLYHGQQLIVAGRFNASGSGPVTLSATRDGKRVEFVWQNVAFSNTAEATYVPAVWAGRKISYLIDQIRTHGESDEMIAEVVALSRAHGIQTPYTSWLVTPEGRPHLQQFGQRWHRDAPGAGTPTLPVGVPRRDTRKAPPGSGMGMGGGGSFGRQEGPRRAPPGPGSGSGWSDEFALQELERGVTDADGRIATFIARQNAQLRDLRNRDGERLDLSRLPIQKLGKRWYHWIGGLLVDEDVNEHTEVITVRFGSEAYFTLVSGRLDLRPALAATNRVMVLIGPNQAILISDGEGLEQFSPEQREQFGLAGG
jgi:hypothetical protein